MTVLVTGASGFVGGRLARLLVERGERVKVLLRPNADRSNVKPLDVEIVTGDLRDEASLERALKGCEGLYHVAADYRLWARRIQDLYDSNVTGTRNILQAALAQDVSRIVYCSSVATLGNPGDGTPANEDTPVSLTDMIGHYKRSKYLAEQAVSEMIEREGLPVVIVNPSTPIGPGDIKPTPTGRVIRDAAMGAMPAYVDTGLNVVHVDDVAQAHILAYEKGEIGRRYVVGGEDMSLQEILAEVSRVAGRRPPTVRIPRGIVYPIAYIAQGWAWLTHGPEPQATVDGLKMSRKKMYFSSDRAMAELGYQPRPAVEALQDAAQWFLRR